MGISSVGERVSFCHNSERVNESCEVGAGIGTVVEHLL